MKPAPFPVADLVPCHPLVEELPAHLEPWQTFRRLSGLPHAALLDSAMPHPQLGRYSYLTADPFEWLTARRDQMLLESGCLPTSADPLA